MWRREHWRHFVLSTDGRGYYGYLTAGFIYHDLTYAKSSEAIEEAFGFEMSHHYVLKDTEGNIFNKTFPGVAICMAPLFLVAYFLSWILGYDPNGYNTLFLLSIQFSAIFSCLIGFWGLKRLILLFGIRPRNAIMASFLTIFGTNIYFYATNLPSLSHIYSFMAISLFLYFVKRSIEFPQSRSLFYAAFFLGLIFLIRPTNITVVLLIPFLAGNKQKLFDWIKENWNQKLKLLNTIIISSLMVAILPLTWWLHTGNPFIWAYTGEGFYWSHPAILKVLFSFQNGAYLYSPIALIGLIGILSYSKNNQLGLITAIIYYSLNLYIISAWWTPTYSGGFGHRAMSDHFIFSGILLAFLLNNLHQLKRIITLSTLSVLSVYSLFQGYQMNKGILPGDFMNAKMYGLLFLKSSNDYVTECDPSHDTHQYGYYQKTLKVDLQSKLAKEIIYFNPSDTIEGEAIFSLSETDPNIQYFLEVNCEKKRPSGQKFEYVWFVISGKDEKDSIIYQREYNFYEIRSEGLEEFDPLQLEVQLQKEGISYYDFYIWNQGRKKFQVRNLHYQVHLFKP